MSNSANRSGEAVFDVLRAVASSLEPIGAAEIADRCELSIGVVHRALATLERTGFVRRQAYSPKYLVGLSSRLIGFATLRRIPMRRIALPFIHELAMASAGSASLTVRIGDEGLRALTFHGGVHKIESQAIGETQPLGLSLAGLAMLARTERDPPREAMRGARGWLARCREHGYLHLSQEETGEVDSISVPIAASSGVGLAAVCCETRRSRDGAASIAARLRTCRRIAAALEARLKGQPGAFDFPFEMQDTGPIKAPR